MAYSVGMHADLIICPCCDAVYERRALSADEISACAHCGAELERGGAPAIDGWLALTVAVAIACIAAGLCPVVRVCVQDICRESTLWQSVAALGQGAGWVIALVAAAIVVFVPVIQIGLLLWVLSFARAGRRAPGFAYVIRMLAAVRPWSMAEISMAGVLVTVIKLSGYLSVAPLAGAWVLLALVPGLVYVSGRDIDSLWTLTVSKQRHGQRNE